MRSGAPKRTGKSDIIRVDVKRKMLKWAIRRSGKTPEDLARDNKGLKYWLSGKRRPTVRQLEKFAATTHAPFGYLFLSEPPDEGLRIPHFRTARGNVSAPSLNLIETVGIVSQRQDWMRDRLIGSANNPLEFVGSARLDDPPAQVARDIRKKLGMPGEQKRWTDAFVGMLNAAENVGICVGISGVVGHNTRRPLDVKEFRGFVLVDYYAPFVFINGTDFKAAQMFTLAYELAHIWVGKDAVFDLHNLSLAKDQAEIACGRIAAEFLIPQKELADTWNKTTTASEMIESLSKRFKVSKIVVARRALDLELVTKEEFGRVCDKCSGETARLGMGGSFYATANLRIGKRFAREIISAARGGGILYREAYHLTGLNRATFDKFAKWLDQERQS